MNAFATRLVSARLLLATIAAVALGTASLAGAAPVQYVVAMSGPNESPPNASPGTGSATVVIDAVAHTMSLNMSWTGLTGTTTACHIHAATAVPGVSTAGVATTTPYFAGFPIGVTSGNYVNTLDMTQASSYNPSYITAHGGTTAQAEADLFQAIADGKAYLNVHSSTFGGGEIRGFLLPGGTPAVPTSWGQIRNLYR
jgi:hypothetical protein